MPAGVPLLAGGGVEEPPPQPLIATMLMVSSKADVANAAALTTQISHAKRPAAVLRSSSENSINSIIGIQRIGKRLRGMRGGVKGGDGIDDPFAVVLTLIPTMTGALDVTVAGVAGPLHIALRGAPAQLTVMLS